MGVSFQASIPKTSDSFSGVFRASENEIPVTSGAAGNADPDI